MGFAYVGLRDILATLISGSLAFAMVKLLELLAVRGQLKQVFFTESLESFSMKESINILVCGAACMQENSAHIDGSFVCADLASVQVPS